MTVGECPRCGAELTDTGFCPGCNPIAADVPQPLPEAWNNLRVISVPFGGSYTIRSETPTAAENAEFRPDYTRGLQRAIAIIEGTIHKTCRYADRKCKPCADKVVIIARIRKEFQP
jgi:hypothetical protein